MRKPFSSFLLKSHLKRFPYHPLSCIFSFDTPFKTRGGNDQINLP